MLQDPGCLAAATLAALGLDFEAVRTKVVQVIPPGTTPPTGHIPFTPRVKQVLELSLRESIDLGQKRIGTEHLLLGMLRDGDGVGAQVLVNDGVTLAVARQEVVGLLASRAAAGEPPSG